MKQQGRLAGRGFAGLRPWGTIITTYTSSSPGTSLHIAFGRATSWDAVVTDVIVLFI